MYAVFLSDPETLFRMELVSVDKQISSRRNGYSLSKNFACRLHVIPVCVYYPKLPHCNCLFELVRYTSKIYEPIHVQKIGHRSKSGLGSKWNMPIWVTLFKTQASEAHWFEMADLTY